MDRWLRALACATLLCVCAAATEMLGPWRLLREDGGCVIAVEVAGGDVAAGDLEGARLCRGETPLAIKPVVRRVQRPLRENSLLVEFTVARADAVPGTYHIDLAGHGAVACALTATPAADASVRVAVLTAHNYPDRTEFERAEKVLGGSFDLLVLLGGGFDRILGTGGWEANRPMVVLTDETAGDAFTASVRGQWPLGLSCGVLGLLSAAREDMQAQAAGRDLNPWQVFLLPQVQWDPGLLASLHSDSFEDLRAPVMLCQRLHIPLIIAPGSATGVVSEPFGFELARPLHIQPGGPRVLLAAASSGETVAAWSDEVALPVDLRALVALRADAHELTATWVPLGGAQAPDVLRYRTSAVPGEIAQAGSGWGLGDAVPLYETWHAATAEAAEALERLSWLPAAQLVRVQWNTADIKALEQAATSSRAAARLARRLAVAWPDFRGAGKRWQDATPELRRDLALRQLAWGDISDDGPLAVALRTPGETTVARAAIHQAERRPSRELTLALLARVRAQAEGGVPIEDDQMLQHRLVATVFDSPYISPTWLRPIALQLRPKLDALSLGPLQRFLDQHGEIRPP